MPVYEGALTARNLRIGIVVSRFNDFITEKLLGGALAALKRHEGDADAATVVWVPGAFELPVVCDRLAASGEYDAIIALGAVIRGSTAHFDYVAGEAAKGIGAVALKHGIPVIFGVLTTDTIEQAIERAGSKLGNKGYEAALAAMEMANLIPSLPCPKNEGDSRSLVPMSRKK
ncbi:MAG: 6,7-dimethyl-8-ribityllumazine synthase [Armatimonadetes bacterium]|nr:6,7-dimethyl-8-ribityllumazine synthase [Armatimonadota bacterium]